MGTATPSGKHRALGASRSRPLTGGCGGRGAVQVMLSLSLEVDWNLCPCHWYSSLGRLTSRVGTRVIQANEGFHGCVRWVTFMSGGRKQGEARRAAVAEHRWSSCPALPVRKFTVFLPSSHFICQSPSLCTAVESQIGKSYVTLPLMPFSGLFTSHKLSQ